MYTTNCPLKTNGLHPPAGYTRPGAVHWIYIGAPAIIYIFYLKTLFILCIFITSSVDPDETPHYAAFHLGLHCS